MPGGPLFRSSSLYLSHSSKWSSTTAVLAHNCPVKLCLQRQSQRWLPPRKRWFSTRVVTKDQLLLPLFFLTGTRVSSLVSDYLSLLQLTRCAAVSSYFSIFLPSLHGSSSSLFFADAHSALTDRWRGPTPSRFIVVDREAGRRVSKLATTSAFCRTMPLLGYHYIHPKTSRPIRQFRKYGDPRYINNEVALIKGLFGLITTDFGMVTQAQLESARLAILRRIPHGAFSLVMHTDYEEFPVVKKSPESRMGAGKSNIHHFAYKLTTGIPLFEIHATGSRRLNQAEAEGIFLAGRPFIPLQTAVVPRGRVDEYHVFK